MATAVASAGCGAGIVAFDIPAWLRRGLDACPGAAMSAHAWQLALIATAVVAWASAVAVAGGDRRLLRLSDRQRTAR